jgi:hypothetical protein
MIIVYLPFRQYHARTGATPRSSRHCERSEAICIPLRTAMELAALLRF